MKKYVIKSGRRSSTKGFAERIGCPTRVVDIHGLIRLNTLRSKTKFDYRVVDIVG